MSTKIHTYSTEAGELVAQHTTDDLRRKTLQPVETYSNGVLKYLPLEERTPVFTPLGIIHAEMVTFYKSGKLKRVFPLNGKLSGYWTQEDEGQLTDPLTIDTPVGILTAKVISLCFYEEGPLRSITFWPESTVSIESPAGKIKTRVGISFSREGKILSLEPAEPTPLKTPIGMITAFDYDAVGINGDSNSLVFDGLGNVAAIRTSLSMITVRHSSGQERAFIPESRESLCSESEQEIVPMQILFDGKGISIRVTADADSEYFDYENHEISTAPFLPQLSNLSKGLICSV
ncbi:hypothetical protein [Maridesulfovibrio sp.]|uniref:hypothetical protein n=1 Tax=Maridesulfovibrio sp. TaxID=2795000 RepID=UPI0029CA47E6|nr:hypothetical protein [Maridesulfovibrio sp.]